MWQANEAYWEAWKGVFQQMCLIMFKGSRNCATPPGKIVTRSHTQIAQRVHTQMFKHMLLTNVSPYGFKPFKPVRATSGICSNIFVFKHFGLNRLNMLGPQVSYV